MRANATTGHEASPIQGGTAAPNGRGHAVVIGGSMGGLLAARVLADHYGRVTVVDRDRFPERPDHRAGAP